MAKLFCKLSHERGEKFSVGGVIYTIGADGYVDVDDAHAPALLQNKAKWIDAAANAPQPFKRPTTPPQPILEDRHDNELSAKETAKLLEKQTQKPAKAPEPEPAPPDWPTVSTDNSKGELLAVCERLVVAGHLSPSDFDKKMSKMDLLEVIERAYDSME